MSNYPQQQPYPQQQGAYPQQAPYPQQEAYPYPQQEPYPQKDAYPPAQQGGGYPPAPPEPQQGGAYPPTYPPAYPEQTGQPPPYQPGAYTQGQAPPYSQQQQQQTVIVQPPTASASVRVERTRNQPELGIGAIIFASVVTFALLSIGCIWPLPCTIIGIVLGVTSAAAGSEGKISSAKTQAGVSIGCTFFGIFSGVAGVVIIFVTIYSVIFQY